MEKQEEILRMTKKLYFAEIIQNNKIRSKLCKNKFVLLFSFF